MNIILIHINPNHDPPPKLNDIPPLNPCMVNTGNYVYIKNFLQCHKLKVMKLKKFAKTL
jgi:hypothetical protein